MNSKTTHQSTKVDVYARVTDRIVEDLAAGVRPWMKSWNAGHAEGRISRPLRHNGTPYRGVNVLLLWSEAQAKGFGSPSWMTYKQAQELGGQVKKGEAGSLVVYADRYTKSETNERGEEAEREVAFMKGYTVFNIEQIDGLPAQYVVPVAPARPPLPLHQAAAAFFTGTRATFCHGASRAFYAPARDFIQLPPAEAFRDAESYAVTKAHELIHWTGYPSRNAREFGRRFGDRAYAFEELVAELGAAFLCADLGITPEVQPDHAVYGRCQRSCRMD